MRLDLSWKIYTNEVKVILNIVIICNNVQTENEISWSDILISLDCFFMTYQKSYNKHIIFHVFSYLCVWSRDVNVWSFFRNLSVGVNNVTECTNWSVIYFHYGASHFQNVLSLLALFCCFFKPFLSHIHQIIHLVYFNELKVCLLSESQMFV